MKRLTAYLLFPALALSTTALASTKVGIVGTATPSVISQSDAGVERELFTGDTVFLGETLKTNANSSAQLMFLDRSALTISPNSSVKIDKFIYDPSTELGEMAVHTSLGALRFVGGALSKKNPVTIKTPVSTIGIRGGIGDTFVDESGATDSTFHHGEAMTMTNADGVTEVTTTPGSGFSQPDAGSRPTKLSGQRLQNRLTQTPTKMAANIAPPVDQGQIDRINQQVRVTPPATPSPQPPQAPINPTVPPADPSAATPAESPNVNPDENPGDKPVDNPPTEQQSPAPSEPTETETPKPPVTNDPLSDSEVRDLKADPKAMLEKFPNGGPKMANYVTRAIATDPSLVDDLASSLDGATDAQASAMGAGFVRGTRLLNAQDPQSGQKLMERVGNIDNPNVKRTFRAIGPRVDKIGVHPLPANIPSAPVPSRSVGSDSNNQLRRTLKRGDIDPNQLRRPRQVGRPGFTPPQALPPESTIIDPTVTPTVTGIVADDVVNDDPITPIVTPVVITPPAIISPPVIETPTPEEPPVVDVGDETPISVGSPPLSPSS